MAEAIVNNARCLGPIRFGDCGFGQLAAGASIGPVCLEWFDLLCVHRGSLDMRIESLGRKILEAGEGLLVLPGTRFQGQAAADGATISVQHFAFTRQGDHWIPLSFRQMHGRRHGVERVYFRGTPGLESDIQHAVELSFAPESPHQYDMRVAQLMIILARLQRRENLPSAPCDPRALDLRNRLDQVQRIQDVTPQTLASWVGLSSSRFRVWFREQFGNSPKKYLVRCRIRNAMLLLRETTKPIKAVANELGYPDLPSFYHDFRRYTATTPSHYRQSHTVLK